MSCVVCFESVCACKPRKVILIKKSQGQVAHTDIYKKVAAELYKVPYEQVTPEMRTVAKARELSAMYRPTIEYKSKDDLRRFFVTQTFAGCL